MIKQIPLSASDFAELREYATGVGVLVGSAESSPTGFSGIYDRIAFPGSYAMYLYPRGDLAAKMLEMSYSAEIDQTDNKLMDKYVSDGRASVGIHIMKLKTGIFKKRFVAYLQLVEPSDHEGMKLCLGAAGSSIQAGVWRQIKDFVEGSRSLPYEDSQSATVG